MGIDNIYIFGMRADTVEGMYRERTYNPMNIFETNHEILQGHESVAGRNALPQ